MSASNISRNGLYKARTVFAVELHPSTVGNVLEGVKEQLNALVLRYVDEIDAVVIAYSNLEILTKKPVIHPYFPYIHLDVRADVLFFMPTPGMPLVGRVNHIGEDYISALVLGVFNVSIPARSVMQDLHFLREEFKWIHLKQPRHQIAEHSYIIFKVEEVRDHGGFFQITGSMRDLGTGAADFLYPDLKLPGPPAAELEDAVMEDVLGEPATMGGARGSLAAADAEGKGGAAAVTADHHDGHSKRRRSSGLPEEPKGKRRRTEGGGRWDKGDAGNSPSANGEAAVMPHATGPAGAAPLAAVPATATPGSGMATGGAGLAGQSAKSVKKKDKRKDLDTGGKGKKAGESQEAGGPTAPQGKEKDGKGGDKGGEKKDKHKAQGDKERDKLKSDSKEKEKGTPKVAAAAVAGAATPAAPAVAVAVEKTDSRGADPGLARDACSNGGVTVAPGVTGKEGSKKEGKESSKKVGKEARKKEGKESRKKEGKESSKKVGKESSKKEGKESSKKEGKESSKKKREDGGS